MMMNRVGRQRMNEVLFDRVNQTVDESLKIPIDDILGKGLLIMTLSISGSTIIMLLMFRRGLLSLV